MADRRRLIQQLPVVNQTDTLQKFFGSTFDQVFQPGVADALSGYIGRKPSYFDPLKDFYVTEPSAVRTKYQLEPTMVSADANNNLLNALFYDDLVNQLRFQGGNVTDHSRLFETEFYCWAPAADLDKLMNYRRYRWLPDGPPVLFIVVPVAQYEGDGSTATFTQPAAVTGAAVDVVVKVDGTEATIASSTSSTVTLNAAPAANSIIEVWRNGNFAQNIIGQTTYTVDASLTTIGAVTLTSGMRVRIRDNTDSLNGWDVFAYEFEAWDLTTTTTDFTVQGVGSGITLVPVDDATTTPETNPQYIVMERGARDQNPWSTVNAWFHVDDISWAGAVPDEGQATRPIIEFYKDIELYNYGSQRRPDVQAVFDHVPPNTDFLAQIDGKSLYDGTNASTAAQLNGRFLQVDDRILALSADDPLLNNRIFLVNSVGGVIHLSLETDGGTGDPQIGDIVRISTAITIETLTGWDMFPWDEQALDPVYTGYEMRYDGTTWVTAQRRIFDQQVPLFSLYDNDGNRLDDPGTYPDSDFAGNALFTFQIGTFGTPVDAVLGVPLVFDSYGNVVMENALVTQRYHTNGTEIAGFYYYRFLTDTPNQDRYSNDWHLAPSMTSQTADSDGLFDIPLNLQANPANEQIETISRVQWFDHFSEIISSQIGFVGEPFAKNNWRNTAKQLNLGTKILQHRNPLLKLMLINSSDNIDFMQAARYVEREYVRFRNKFVQKVNDFLIRGVLEESDAATTWVAQVLRALTVAKTTDFPFAYSGMAGGDYFIPPTPSYLGILPLAPPLLFTDDDGTLLLRGHDGSLTTAFNDFRDAIMLELESEIYASANSAFRGEDRPLFDIVPYVSGKFRTGDYNRDEWLLLLRPMFDRFVTQNQIDYQTNSTFVQDEPFTFNYAQLTDRDGDPLPGHWRGIYRWYYDTDRPHTHPWEMLGFAAKPTYWDSRYGAAPYTRGNTTLWTDLEQGFIAGGVRQGTNATYARPGLSKVIPVDDLGLLLDPIAIGIVSAPTLPQAKANWQFGDNGPGETVWRNSVAYPFDLAQAAYLAKPARFAEQAWNPSAQQLVYPVSAQQWIDSTVGSRPPPSQYHVHGETVDDTVVRTTGYQQWISDYIVSQGQDVATTFGLAVRGLDVRLAHKMAGYTTADNMKLRADNVSGPLPAENIKIQFYQSRSIREDFYGGIIVEWTGRSYRVYGYDILNPFFLTLPGDPAGPKTRVSVNPQPLPVNPWRPNTSYTVNALVVFENTVWQCVRPHISAQRFEQSFWVTTDQSPNAPAFNGIVKYLRGLVDIVQVPYGTELFSKQAVADLLLGYERYLTSRGWVFDQMDPNTSLVRDFTLSVREFLAWSETQWAPGNFIALSPAAAGISYVAQQGTVQSMERLINGVYPLLDRSGHPIDSGDTFVNRLDSQLTVVPKNANLYAARLFIAELEHILVFDNVTIFNDIIYQPLFNLRQPRLRFLGVRTQDWAGRIDAPGYVVTSNTIIANFEKTAEDVRHMFDIEATDNKTLTDYARHVVGYQSRDYLQNLFLSETSQFEFYLGMIQQKGAPSVFTKLLRSDFINADEDIKFLEEWAFRLGEYGATDITTQIEMQLQQSEVLRDPQLITFWVGHDENVAVSDSPFDDRIELIDGSEPDSRWVLRPDDPQHVFAQRDDFGTIPGSLPSAGYVRLDEVAYTVVHDEDIATLYQNLADGNLQFAVGDLIWVFITAQDTFDVRRVSVPAASAAASNTLVSIAITTTGSLLTLNAAHGLQVGDTIIINGDSRSVPDLQGIQTVTALTSDSRQVVIAPVTTTAYDWTSNTDNPNNDVAPSVFVLRSVRFATTTARNAFVPADGWDDGDLTFIDGSSSWTVERYNGDALAFAAYRSQPKKLDTTRVVSGLVYSSKTQITPTQLIAQPLVIDVIEVYDPLCGLVPGLAARELSYMLEYDPAKYNAGSGDIDADAAWGDAQVGRLWWDLSTVRYLETELDDISTLTGSAFDREMAYRIANWGKVAPGTSVDVYEWVKSTTAPLDWANQVAASNGVDPFSGTVRNADAPSWVETTQFDMTLGQEVTVYYFWVKNRQTVPPLPDRTETAAAVAQVLTSPSAVDIAWLSPVATNAVIVSGIVQFLNDTDTILQITTKKNDYEGNRHRQWALLRKGDASSQPSDQLWRKMRDSLVGRDRLRQLVPDPSLHENMRYGNLIRPRQTWFVDNLLARKIFVNAVNLILSRTSLIDERPDFITDLTLSTPADQDLIWVQPIGEHTIRPLPLGGTGLDTDEWDIQVSDFDARDALTVSVGSRVLVADLVNDTPQWSVWRYDPSNSAADSAGYVLATAYDYHVASTAERDALITTVPLSTGARVLVDGSSTTNGFWTVWVFNGLTFDLVKAQTYRTSDFWVSADWFATGFSADNPPSVSYATVSARNLAQGSTPQVTFVEVDDDGTGRWIWTQFVDGGWQTVAKQNATARLISDVFDSSRVVYGYDNFILTDIANRDGSWELHVLADALRDTLLTASEVNELFFDMVSFVHSEQDQVDWVFKTSFMFIGGFDEPLVQNPVALPDETENLLSFVQEVKPYHVTVRDFVRHLVPSLDVANVAVTDFDNPPYFDASTSSYRPLDLDNPSDNLLVQTTEPWKTWYSNLADLRTQDGIFSIDNPTRRLKVTLTFDRTSCQRAQDGFDQTGFGAAPFDDASQINAAYRIDSFYQPLPGMPEKDLSQLISGCGEGSTIDGGTLSGQIYDVLPWETFLWDFPAPPDPSTYDSLIDASTLVNPQIDSEYDGGAFLMPHGPEELVSLRGADPVIISVYDNWSAGAPAEMSVAYTGDGATATFALGQLPQATTGIAVFVDGVRLSNNPTPSYAVNMMARVLTFVTPPANGSSIELHSFGLAGTSRIVGQLLRQGDGATTMYTMTVPANPSQEAATEVLVNVDGSFVTPTIMVTAVTLSMAAQSDDIVVVRVNGSTVSATTVGTATTLAVPVLFTSSITVSINGTAVPLTYQHLTITISPAPISGVLIVLTAFDQPATLLARQEAVIDNAHAGIETTYTLTQPSTGIIPAEAATIVEVNGLRLASPEIHYIDTTPDARIIPLDRPVSDVANVYLWNTDIVTGVTTPLGVCTVSQWTTPADIDLNNVPSRIDSTSPFFIAGNTYNEYAQANKIVSAILVENYIALIDINGGIEGWDLNPWDATAWDDLVSTNGQLTVMIREDNDWSITGDQLTIHKHLAIADTVSFTTFANDKPIDCRAYTFFGNSINEYPIYTPPYDNNYLWLTLQIDGDVDGNGIQKGGRRLIQGLDYSVEFASGAFGDVAESEAGTDPGSTQWVILLKQSISLNDIVCVNVMSGTPNAPPVAWRVFTDQIGNRERLRIADANKTRLVSTLTSTSTSFDVVADSNLPAAFRATPPLASPDAANNNPGVVWIGAERIEYNALSVNNNVYTLSELRRGSSGTTIGSYDASTLVIDGSVEERFADDINATSSNGWDDSPWDISQWDSAHIYLQQQVTVVQFNSAASTSWDSEPWDEAAWDIVLVEQKNVANALVSFLLEKSGTYEK